MRSLFLHELTHFLPGLGRGLGNGLVDQIHAVSGDLVKQIHVSIAGKEYAAAALGQIILGIGTLCGVADNHQVTFLQLFAIVGQILREASDKKAILGAFFCEQCFCLSAGNNMGLVLCGNAHEHDGHHHEDDPHIWLSPVNAKIMVNNICHGLVQAYPQYEEVFRANEQRVLQKLDELHAYGQQQLSGLSCRELITFHDGFGYFADCFDLTILEAVEEESGSEASAQELKHLISIVREHDLPAVFIEANGSVSAAEVIARETGAKICTLDMAMGGDSYFDAMYNNINIIKEAMG